MRKRYDKKLLDSILNTVTPSFYEDELVDLYLERLSGKATHVGRDVLKNASAAVIGQPSGSVVMLTAHADEVGFVVTGHTEDGFLMIAPLGYPDPAALPGALLEFYTPEGCRVVGIVHRTPVHLFDTVEAEMIVDSTVSCLVDVGASSCEEAQEQVPSGSFGVWATHPEKAFFGGKMFARGADNKLSVYIITRVMEELAKLNQASPIPAQVYGVLTSAEEVEDCLSGCLAAARKITPSIALVLDTCPVGPFPHSPDTIDYANHGLSHLMIMNAPSLNYEFYTHLYNTAIDLEVDFADSFEGGSLSGDADLLRTVGPGCAVGVVLLPLRGIHSGHSLFDPGILEPCVNLIVESIMTLKDLVL